MNNARRNVLSAAIERAFPERRMFLRSDSETRFVRLSPVSQLLAVSGTALFVGWTIVASAVVLMDSIGSGNVRDQAAREQRLYEERLNEMSGQRDAALAEARAARDRFEAALAQVSDMQSELLTSESSREELELGMEIAQSKLKQAIVERDEVRSEIDKMVAKLDGGEAVDLDAARLSDYRTTIAMLSSALGATAEERDLRESDAIEAEQFAEEMILEARLAEDRNDRIFSQLEEALSISVSPLDKMFRNAGLNTENLLSAVRRGYSGQGGPLTPINFSTKGVGPTDEGVRANGILEKLDRMNLYRIAAERAPFALPVKDSFRFTSGFGPRWGRMHNGTDFAGAHGTPIYSTADGVITFAGRQSGYGNIVKIQHEFGIETRYAHLSRIRVKVGQRVSRGDRIGDMGNTGRSTGTHLHYEVRVNGRAVNPMTFIKAARNVF
ncbi:M23 family metallopeptidase [Palleronia caenipelagi]|nr:M23 family metallopeptidase [Palleronia caenipelagi]